MASERDIQDVIKTLIAEGIGEGEEGMRRIAETILNRAEQRGISPAEVVRQPAQYTGFSAPGPAAVRAQSDPAAISAAQAAWELAQGPDDPTGGANHYWNPGIVNPSWAGGMTQLGNFGNHAFASDRPVPPRNIPVVPPTPASVAPLMAASRSVTSPTGGDTGLQEALNRVATRERNRVTPAPVEDRVNARNNALVRQDQLREATRRAALQVNQPTIERVPTRSAFNGDPGIPAAGPVVASIPTLARDAPSRAALTANQSFIERAPPTPEPSSSDAARRAALSIGSNQTYAGQDRGSSSTVGRPPTTRVVQTVPMPALSRAATSEPRPVSRDAFNGDPLTRAAGPVVATIPTTRAPAPMSRAPISYAGQERAPAAAPIRQDDIGAMPSFQALQDMLGQRVNPSAPDRLAPSPAGLPANYGTMTPAQVAGIGQALLPALPPPAPIPRAAPAPMPPMPRPAPLMAAAAPQRMPIMAQAPLRVSVQGATPIPVPAPRLAPVSIVNQYRSEGMSPSQAYDTANRAAVERAIANSANPDQARRLNERLGNL